jgi:MtN3 and saliva related transmembrane protein
VDAITPVEWLGTLAGTLTTISFVPQLVTTWRARSGRGLSYSMLAIFDLGVTLWLVYGILTRSRPIIFANAVTLVLAGAILALKVRFDIRDRHALSPRTRM